MSPGAPYASFRDPAAAGSFAPHATGVSFGATTPGA
jgi:hypothetical protein